MRRLRLVTVRAQDRMFFHTRVLASKERPRKRVPTGSDFVRSIPGISNAREIALCQRSLPTVPAGAAAGCHQGIKQPALVDVLGTHVGLRVPATL